MTLFDRMQIWLKNIHKVMGRFSNKQLLFCKECRHDIAQPQLKPKVEHQNCNVGYLPPWDRLYRYFLQEKGFQGLFYWYEQQPYKTSFKIFSQLGHKVLPLLPQSGWNLHITLVHLEIFLAYRLPAGIVHILDWASCLECGTCQDIVRAPSHKCFARCSAPRKRLLLLKNHA